MLRRTQIRRRALKPKRSTLIHRQRVRVDRAAHFEDTSSIRRATLERARGRCECGPSCDHQPEEMDHFFGRRQAEQSIETCWMLSQACHRRKTENKPDRMTWLARFRDHCRRHGYADAATLADGLYSYQAAKTGRPPAVDV